MPFPCGLGRRASTECRIQRPAAVLARQSGNRVAAFLLNKPKPHQALHHRRRRCRRPHRSRTTPLQNGGARSGTKPRNASTSWMSRGLVGSRAALSSASSGRNKPTTTSAAMGCRFSGNLSVLSSGWAWIPAARSPRAPRESWTRAPRAWAAPVAELPHTVFLIRFLRPNYAQTNLPRTSFHVRPPTYFSAVSVTVSSWCIS